MSGGRSLTTRSDGRLAQLQSAHDVVRHNLHDDAAVAREAIEVFAKRPHFESVVDGIGHELVRARADGVISQLASRAGGHDLEHEIRQERAGRLLQHEVDGVAIDRHDRGEIAKRAAPWRGEGRIEHAREREHDVLGCQLVAVVEAHALAQPDPIRLMIRRVPRNGEAGREARLIVPAQQVVEEQLLRPGGVLIGPVSRVEVVGRDRNSDGDDAGFGCRLRAACRQQTDSAGSPEPPNLTPALSSGPPTATTPAGASCYPCRYRAGAAQASRLQDPPMPFETAPAVAAVPTACR